MKKYAICVQHSYGKWSDQKINNLRITSTTVESTKRMLVIWEVMCHKYLNLTELQLNYSDHYVSSGRDVKVLQTKKEEKETQSTSFTVSSTTQDIPVAATKSRPSNTTHVRLQEMQKQKKRKVDDAFVTSTKQEKSKNKRTKLSSCVTRE